MTASRSLLVLAMACLTLPASAETLEEAWALALQNDRSLAAARSHAEAAALEAKAARAQRWPTVAVSGSYSQLDDSPAFDFSFTGLPIAPPDLFEDGEVVTGGASISVPLYTGGRIAGSIGAAEAGQRGAEAQFDAATGDLRLAVAMAYVDVLRARKALEVARSHVQSLQSLAQDTASLFERELVPKNELLASQVALADARQRELRAANALEVAQASYNRRLGEPLDRPVSLDESLPASGPLPPTLTDAVAAGLAGRAELGALRAHADGLGQQAKAERARTLPQVALGGGYHYLDNQFLDDDSVGVAGIGVQWALFDGGQSRNRAAALERSRRATEQQREDVASLVELQVREAWLGAEEARQRIAVASGAAEQADESLRIAQERYRAGLGTQTQLLEAETQRVGALRNRDDAVLDAALSRLRLARAIGAL